MNKRTIRHLQIIATAILTFTLIVIVLLCFCIVAKGRGKDEIQFHAMTAKAYCIDGITATGSHTRKGIAAAKPEWIGLTAVVYENNNGQTGDFLGYYEIKDTGGQSIRAGKTIDIWLPTETECKQFGKKKVLVALVKGVG